MNKQTQTTSNIIMKHGKTCVYRVKEKKVDEVSESTEETCDQSFEDQKDFKLGAKSFAPSVNSKAAKNRARRQLASVKK